MIALNVSVGDSVALMHEEHGKLANIRVEHKSGRTVRLIFDLALSMSALLNHRESKITVGLTGEPRRRGDYRLHKLAV